MTRGSTPGVHAPDEGELGRPQGDGGAVVLNFACENGLTDVADLLLQHSAQVRSTLLLPLLLIPPAGARVRGRAHHPCGGLQGRLPLHRPVLRVQGLRRQQVKPRDLL